MSTSLCLVALLTCVLVLVLVLALVRSFLPSFREEVCGERRFSHSRSSFCCSSFKLTNPNPFRSIFACPSYDTLATYRRGRNKRSQDRQGASRTTGHSGADKEPLGSLRGSYSTGKFKTCQCRPESKLLCPNNNEMCVLQKKEKGISRKYGTSTISLVEVQFAFLLFLF